jgi:hypothetical protein
VEWQSYSTAVASEVTSAAGSGDARAEALEARVAEAEAAAQAAAAEAEELRTAVCDAPITPTQADPRRQMLLQLSYSCCCKRSLCRRPWVLSVSCVHSLLKRRPPSH